MLELDPTRLPRHVAVIMDGNGRWAEQRGLPRLYGHRVGKDSVRAVVETSRRLGIKYLSLYAFSTENWARPLREVDGLMALLRRYLASELGKMMQNQIRLRAVGSLRRLPPNVREALRATVEATKRNTGMTVMLAVSYGGREEIAPSPSISVPRASPTRTSSYARAVRCASATSSCGSSPTPRSTSARACGRSSVSASTSRRSPSSSSASAASAASPRSSSGNDSGSPTESRGWRGARERADALVLKTRLLTAVVAIPALWLIVCYLPSYLFAGFILSVAAVALFEYFEMAIPDHAEERGIGVGWGILVAAAVVSGQPQFLGAGLALAVVLGLILPLVRTTDPLGATQRLGLSLLGVLYFGFLTPHIVLLRSGDDGWRWVLFTVFTAMGSDSGGYFAGRAFGRHPLAPAVSPSKTIEGGIGAIAGAVVIAVLAKFIIIPQLGLREAMVLGAIVSVLAQLGDLCESALKRAFGAKDSGWIIPGHGGILDRLDSLLFPIVFAYYYAALPRF